MSGDFDHLPQNTRDICEGRREGIDPLAQIQYTRWCEKNRHRSQPVMPRPQPNPVKRTEGVGSEVSAILATLGISTGVCGGCNALMEQMNAWGVGGCETNREAILTRLRERAATMSWWATRKAETLAVATGLFLDVNWLDPSPGILDMAIRTVLRKLATGQPH